MHEDRLICDNTVYSSRNTQIQTFKFEDIKCGCVIDSLNVLIGTGKNYRFFHLKWNG